MVAETECVSKDRLPLTNEQLDARGKPTGLGIYRFRFCRLVGRSRAWLTVGLVGLDLQCARDSSPHFLWRIYCGQEESR